MLFRRRSIATKLFAGFLLTSICIILVIVLLIGHTLRSGFSSYLLEVELQNMDALVTAIARTHEDEADWQRLTSSPSAWHALVRQSMAPKRAEARALGGLDHRPPPSRAAPQRPPPASHRSSRHSPAALSPAGGARSPIPADPLRLGIRLSLLSPDGAHLAGAPLSPSGYKAREIHALKMGEKGPPRIIGLLALSKFSEGAWSRNNHFLSDQLRALVFVSLLAIALSAFASFVLARGVVTPIRALVRGTRELKSGNYAARMPEQGTDEIGRLVSDFNALAESLEAAEKAERQWISNASHELKTPLAILKGRIEGLQDGIYQADEKLLDEMHETVERLDSLVNDLNILAHAREGHLLCDLTPENLSDLVDDAVTHSSARFRDKDIVVQVRMPDDLILPADRIRLRQLLDNLLENARRYTDAPGQVLIRASMAESADAMIRLAIEDSAPCPASEDIAHLFERFYRTDPSRTRQSGGAGLGLAICRAIVRAHGGTIRASKSDLGGLKVEIDLPGDQRRVFKRSQ